MGRVGIEPTADSFEKTATSQESGAKSGPVHFDPDLTSVNDAWDSLSPAIRAAIVAMIRATGG